MEEMIVELIEFLKNASPVIWESFVRQARIEGVSYIVWSLILFAVVFFGYRVGRDLFESDEEIDMWFRFGSFAVCVGSGFLGIYYLIEGLMWLSNPEFYAIRYMIEKLSSQ